jgi:hypothetical protein
VYKKNNNEKGWLYLFDREKGRVDFKHKGKERKMKNWCNGVFIKKILVLLVLSCVLGVSVYAQNTHVYGVYTYQDFQNNFGTQPDERDPLSNELDLIMVNSFVRHYVGIEDVIATHTAGEVEISKIEREIIKHPNLREDILKMQSELHIILEKEKNNYTQIRGIILSYLEKHLTVLFILDKNGNITSQEATFWDDAMNADEIKATNEALKN